MARRINKLKKPATRTLESDLHTHVYTNYRYQASRRFLEEGFRDLTRLTKLCVNGGLGIVGVTNFTDWNYEFWTSSRQLGDLPADWRQYQDERVTYIETEQGKGLYLVKSEEIPTDKGHLLLIGCPRGKNIGKGNLSEVLGKAGQDPLITIVADHPYMGRIGLRGEIDRVAIRLDALEYNSNCSRAENKKAEQEAQRLGKPLIANSDSHRPQDIGIARTNFLAEDLRYSCGENFVGSLRLNIIGTKFGVEKGSLGLPAKLEHVGLLIAYNVLRWIPGFTDIVD